MEHCPSDESLAIYAAGAHGAPQARAIEAHLRRCARCRAAVAQDRSNIDWLAKLKRPVDDETVAARPSPDFNDVAAGTAMDVQADCGRPIEIEGYRVQRELGGGGQSVIYQAIQDSTGQQVAIKVPREGRYITKAERRRFEREIELVAQLKHPNIISIFDSGLTQDGRKYYVMDFVRGRHLHHFVRERKLDLERALDLFARVCDAVQFAHQRGVIHRDLKPANILVDTDGNPKVLDFGLARGVGGAAQTVVSITQELLGTLPYMSPEQTRGNPDEVDIRTDVYALGVILYELLTGAYPYTVTGNVVDALQTIAEVEPAPPGRRWTPETGIAGPIGRKSRPDECPIDDELHTIVVKALAKDRERRYQSARELAADIRHYLAGEPIEAKRDSGWYVLRKTIRRHRVAAGAALGFLILATMFGIVTSILWQLSRASEQRASEALTAVDDLLGNEVEKLGSADVVEALQRLGMYQTLANAQAGAALDALHAALRQVESEALDKLDRCLATNDLDALVDALRTQESVRQALDTLAQSRRSDIKQRLIDRLANAILVPVSIGGVQRTFDRLALIRTLAGDGETGRRASADMFAPILREFDEIMVDRFTLGEPGQFPPGWEGEEGFARIADAPGGRALQVRSTEDNAPGVTHRIAGSPSAPYISVDALLAFAPPPGERRRSSEEYASIYVRWGAGQDVACRISPRDSPRVAVDRADHEISLVDPLLAHTDHEQTRVRLLIDSVRDRYDVVIDDALALEDLPCDSTGPGAMLELSTHGGAVANVYQIRVTAGSRPFKRDYGPITPVVRSCDEHVALSSATHIPHAVTSVIATDVDRDGGAELVAGLRDEAARALQVFKFDSSRGAAAFDTTVLVSRATTLLPRGTIDGSCAVWERYTTSDPAVPRIAISLFDLQQDGIEQPVFTKTYDGLNHDWGTVAPVRGADGRRGFVIGTRHYANRLEFFVADPANPAAPYVALGEHRVTGPDFPDDHIEIIALAPCDRNADGVDDCVFLGLGPFDWRPAVLTTAGDLLAPKGPPQVRPLTPDPVGLTHVAVSNLGQATPYLIAASGRKDSSDDGSAAGLRVWRVEELFGADIPEPVRATEDPQDVRALTTGTVGGRDVFAVAVSGVVADATCRNIHLRMYALEYDQLELLWEATLFDVGLRLVQEILLADLDRDGNDELIANMQFDGLLVFSQPQFGAPRVP